jgi:hypothetical protein
MVDFCFALKMLAPDGYLMIDDVQIYAIKELVQFILEQPGFEEVLNVEKAIVFQRHGDFTSIPGWWAQPYIVRHTNEDQKRGVAFKVGLRK